MIKTGLVIITFPALTMVLSYALFYILPRSYTAESRIQVIALDLHESEEQLGSRIHEIASSMNQPRMQTLLSYKLAIHDLGEASFTDVEEIREIYPPEMLEFAGKIMQEKLNNLQLGLSTSSIDSMISDILVRMNYTPEKIGERISVRRIPDTEKISIHAHADASDIAAYMVNTYADEYIRYYEVVGKERMEKSVDLLEKLLEQRRKDLEEKSVRLQYHREFIRGQAMHSEIAGILSRISTLEINRKEEEELIESLKTAMLNKQKSKQTPAIIRTADIKGNISDDDRELMVELGSALARKQFIEQQIHYLKGKLAIKEETALAPYRQEVEVAKTAYLEVLGKLKSAKDTAVSLSHSLRKVSDGKVRFPFHQAPLFLSLLAGIASLVLWVAFLLNIRYL